MSESRYARAVLAALADIPLHDRLHADHLIRVARRSLSDSEIALILDIEESEVCAGCTPVTHHSRRICISPTRRPRRPQ